MQPSEDELAGLDTPRYRVSVLQQAAEAGPARNADEQAEAVEAAFKFGRLEDIAAGAADAAGSARLQPEWGSGGAMPLDNTTWQWPTCP